MTVKSPTPVYVIPPYLLNTSLGLGLQNTLKLANRRLGETNSIATDSKYFESKPNNPPVPQYHFSADPIINEIIREKLVYKMGIIGVLGTTPKPAAEFTDEELFELFDTFKHKLLLDINTKDEEHDEDAAYVDKLKLKKVSIESDKFGEIVLANSIRPNMPAKYQKYLAYTLRQLLFISKLESNSQFSSRPSFVKFGDSYFNYSLPCSWVSLVPNSYLNSVNRRMELSTNQDLGYSNIELKTLKDAIVSLEAPINKYFNFISNKPVPPSCGIYYYECEITQECTEATDMIPLLSVLDASLSSQNSPQFSLGFTKRYINYELRRASTPPSPANSLHGSTKIDLEEIKNELVFNQDSAMSRPVSASIETLLDAKPGEFRGSFALDLSDLNFYNSIKGSESAQRSILNMNRRLSSMNRQNIEEMDSGKINTEVTFATNSTVETMTEDTKSGHGKGKRKILKSDVVGCGINYIDRSLFITLNGVLIRTITKEELSSNNPLNDNIFSESNVLTENSVYPIIGFKLNDVSIDDSFDPTKLNIKTNLGFQDFKFNINNYMNTYRKETQKNLNMVLLNQSQAVNQESNKSSIEHQLLNVHDDSKLLNKLIKGYLNTEGYIDTFNALNSDLDDLNETMDLSKPSTGDNKILEQSHGAERQELKSYFAQNQFPKVLEFLKVKYFLTFKDEEGMKLVFEIKLHRLIYLLKVYVEKLLNLNSHEFDFEYQTNLTCKELYTESLDLMLELYRDYGKDEAQIESIKAVSVLLLVKDETSYNNLPHISSIIDNYDDRIKDLSDKVNKKILKSLGFNAMSNLESLIHNVDQNVQSLSLKHYDQDFSLINFERDLLTL